jgi:integrase
MPRTIGDGRGLVEKKVKVKVNGRAVTETRLYARVRYTDETGKRRAKWKRVANRTEGKTAVQELAAEARRPVETLADLADKTFGDLANHYAAFSLIPAEYRDGRKVSGRRSLRGMDAHLARLAAHFGAERGESGAWSGGLPLSALDYERLVSLRAALLAAPVRVTDGDPTGRPRAIATVNRNLSLLRNMLNVAARKRWLTRNPFSDGPALINPADEVRRKRILSYEEEDRLLAQCVSYTETREGKPPRNVFRAHLRAIVVCALDTAMRCGEILKLRWRDLDAMAGGGRGLTVQQMNTKTLEERGAPVSNRLRSELDRLRRESGGRPDALVFGVMSNVKRSFAGACRDAGVVGLRFHDLRRTAATRLHREGMPIGEVSRILGHSNVTTTYRYIGVDAETVERAADIFDRIEEKRREARKTRMRDSA